jgi:small-conductance mechanosensitive channel/regulator of replication initiation timing
MYTNEAGKRAMKTAAAQIEKQDPVSNRGLVGNGILRISWGMVLASLMFWHVITWSIIAFGADTDPTAQDAVQRIMTAQENLAGINRRIEKETYLASQGPGAEQADRNRNVARLQEIKFIHQRLISSLKKNISLAAEEADLQKKIESGMALTLAEQKPYSLSYYDRLLDEVAAVQRKKEVLATSTKTADRKLDQTSAGYEKAQQYWRRIKEEVEAEKGDAAEDDPKYNQAQLQREAARAAHELQEALQSGNQGQLRLIELKQQAAKQKLELIKKDLSFDPAALNKEIGRLEEQKIQLNARLQDFVNEQKKVEIEWQADRSTLEPAATEGALKAREAWREAYESALQQNEDMTQLLNTQGKLWKMRYALVGADPSAQEFDQWKDEASTARQQTRQAVGIYQTWQVNLQSRIADVEKERGQADPMVNKYIDYHLDALKKTEDFGGNYISTILTTGQLAGRLLDETAAQRKGNSLLDKAFSTRSTFSDFWNLELWAIDDHGVTVKKIATALVILILGILAVKAIIKSISKRLTRAKFEAGSVTGTEKLLQYTGFVLVVLFALRIVNIPLTAFTFLGGAIAIGVGFGAQNLINNFISGFIIMAERPIRIGDLIELDGRPVRVQEIGARCTRVKTEENIHILVPNSSFLEKNITNWTLSDKKIRTRLSVGAAYGSDINQVTGLLLEAADQTELILKAPKPAVIFEDFGDSALVFEIHYWLNIGGMVERRKIASDLRYRINKLFRKHEIVIAYPQQDIHLDAINPLKIQLSEKGYLETLKRPKVISKRKLGIKNANPK